MTNRTLQFETPARVVDAFVGACGDGYGERIAAARHVLCIVSAEALCSETPTPSWVYELNKALRLIDGVIE